MVTVNLYLLISVMCNPTDVGDICRGFSAREESAGSAAMAQRRRQPSCWGPGLAGPSRCKMAAQAEQCAVCLSELRGATLHLRACCHGFHARCLLEALQGEAQLRAWAGCAFLPGFLGCPTHFCRRCPPAALHPPVPTASNPKLVSNSPTASSSPHHRQGPVSLALPAVPSSNQRRRHHPLL